jgi:hypothetical protein
LRRPFIIFFVFILPFSLFAQFSAGIKTAIPFFNANRPFGDLEIENIVMSDMGYFPIINLGVFLNYSFNSSLALQTEIKYTYEGFMYQNPPDLESNDMDGVYLKFVEFPLLLQYEWGNKFKWFFESGISIKYLTSFEYFFEHDRNIDEISKELNKFVLKSNLGGGFSWTFYKNLIFTGGMRWGYDITPIINKVRFLKMDISFGIAYKIK